MKVSVGGSLKWQGVTNPGNPGELREYWLKVDNENFEEDIRKNKFQTKNQKSEATISSSDNKKYNDSINNKDTENKDKLDKKEVTNVREPHQQTKKVITSVERTKGIEINKIGTLPVKISKEDRIQNILLQKFQKKQLQYLGNKTREHKEKDSSYYNYYTPIMSTHENDAHEQEPPQKNVISEVICDPADKMTGIVQNPEMEILFSNVQDMEAEDEESVAVVQGQVTTENEFTVVSDKRKKTIPSLKNSSTTFNEPIDDYDIAGKRR
jgi:hypothetical protein